MYKYIHIYTCIHICIYIHEYLYIYVYTYKKKYTHLYVYIFHSHTAFLVLNICAFCIYPSVNLSICKYSKQIYTHTNIHIFTYMYCINPYHQEKYNSFSTTLLRHTTYFVKSNVGCGQVASEKVVAYMWLWYRYGVLLAKIFFPFNVKPALIYV